MIPLGQGHMNGKDVMILNKIKHFILFISLCLSIIPCYAQEWLMDFDAMMEAKLNPIIIKTHNDSCFLEQHFYQDGNLFIEVPVINGMRTGVYKEYYTNGQLRERYEMKDGIRTDSTTEIVYDRDGNYAYLLINIEYKGKRISCRTDYYHGKRNVMFFHEEKPQYKLLAEYIFENGNWVNHPHHATPVKYANHLLRIYRKKWKQKFPNIEF